MILSIYLCLLVHFTFPQLSAVIICFLLSLKDNQKNVLTDGKDGWEFLVCLHGVLLIAAFPREGESLNNTAASQEFKDRNGRSTLGQLTSDRTPVNSSQKAGTWVLHR